MDDHQFEDLLGPMKPKESTKEERMTFIDDLKIFMNPKSNRTSRRTSFAKQVPTRKVSKESLGQKRKTTFGNLIQ